MLLFYLHGPHLLGIALVAELFPVQPAGLTVAVNALERLVFRNDHVVDAPEHLRLNEAVAAAVGKSACSHAVRDGLLPVHVLPVAAEGVRGHKVVVLRVIGLFSAHDLEGIDLCFFVLDASDGPGDVHDLFGVYFLAEQIALGFAVVPGVGRDNVLRPLELALDRGVVFHVVFIFLGLALLVSRLGPVPPHLRGLILGKGRDMAGLAGNGLRVLVQPVVLVGSCVVAAAAFDTFAIAHGHGHGLARYVVVLRLVAALAGQIGAVSSHVDVIGPLGVGH